MAKRLKPDTKPTICMSCHQKIEMKFSETLRVWQGFDHGTSILHRCEEKK